MAASTILAIMVAAEFNRFNNAVTKADAFEEVVATAADVALQSVVVQALDVLIIIIA